MAGADGLEHCDLLAQNVLQAWHENGEAFHCDVEYSQGQVVIVLECREKIWIFRRPIDETVHPAVKSEDVAQLPSDLPCAATHRPALGPLRAHIRADVLLPAGWRRIQCVP